MEPIEISEIPVLNVEKAIKALQDYIKELEEQKCEELTDKQVNALIKFTEGLTPPVETETPYSLDKKDQRNPEILHRVI